MLQLLKDETLNRPASVQKPVVDEKLQASPATKPSESSKQELKVKRSVIDVRECQTQVTERETPKTSPSPRRSTRMRREETSRKKMTTTQGCNATINTVNIKKQTATVAVAPGVTIQTVKEKEIKGVDEFTAKEVATQVDDDIMTLTKIDDEPSVVQRQPNQYEKLAGEKHMVVDPILVMKRGNIDNMYMVRICKNSGGLMVGGRGGGAYSHIYDICHFYSLNKQK
ncbi:unnamed protein product [Haemonchus placei]|uniref:GAR domain-containing protein n=1 Tax=Haemonchus placei TaxID=6290 RepID=A0A0N4WZU1_HAEPC|nr:unnamed protein product [Haemonchus placei]